MFCYCLQYSGPGDALRQAWRQGGLRGLYKGYTATYLRESCGSAVMFASYELVKQQLTRAQVSLCCVTPCMAWVRMAAACQLMQWPWQREGTQLNVQLLASASKAEQLPCSSAVVSGQYSWAFWGMYMLAPQLDLRCQAALLGQSGDSMAQR